MVIAWLLAAAQAADPVLPHGPGVAWHTLDTRFFRVHWVEGPDGSARRTAERAAAICDGLLLRISAEAAFVPHGPYDLVVSDATDGMVAFARPSEGRVVIGTDPGAAVLRLRGRLDWVEDALAHELSHLVWDRRTTPFAQSAGYGVEAVAVVEAGPVAVAVDGFLLHDLPYGFGEALAELGSEGAGVNAFDERRSGLLLAAARDGRLLDWDEWAVGVDKGDTFDAERAYQQGWAFLSWLRGEAGEDVLREVGEAWARRPGRTLDRVLGSVTGTRGRTWWAEHRGVLVAEAVAADAARTARARPTAVELERWPERRGLSDADRRALEHPREEEERRESTGSWDLFPHRSPDGRFTAESKALVARIAKLGPDGTEAADAWVPSATGAAVAFLPGRDAALVVTEARPGAPAWWPGTPGRARVWEVGLAVDRAGALRASTRRGLRRVARPIPGTERTREVAVEPRGGLVLVRHVDDADQLWTLPGPAGGEATRRTTFPPGTWLQSPSVSPDGARLAVSVFRENRGELWIADLPTWRWERLPTAFPDVLDPAWTADGCLLATAPVGGAWQVVRLDPATGDAEVLTHTFAGASTPAEGPDGALWFSEATAFGLKSSALDAARVLPAPVPTPAAPPPPAASHPLPTAPVGPARPYRAWPRPPTAGPLLRLESGPAGRGSAGGLRLAGGGWLDLHDAVDTWTADLFGVVGTVSGGAVDLDWSGLGPTLTGAFSGATTSDGARWVGEARAGAALAWSDGIEVRPGVAWIEASGRETLRSRRLLLDVVPADAPAWGRAGTTGALWLTGAADAVGDRAQTWVRAEGQLTTRTPTRWSVGPLDEHAVAVEGGLRGGVTSALVDPRARLALGGDLGGAWRPLAVEGSTPFPALPPWARSGRHLAVGSARLAIPVAPRARRAAGGLYLRGFEVLPGVDAAAWAGPGAPAAIGAAVAELRAYTRWGDRDLVSRLVVAAATDGSPPRVQLDLGGARPP